MAKQSFTKVRTTANHSELQELMSIGFSNYEAQAYLKLLQDYPATAYEISKRGALTKANVYSALESLVQKGAVQPVSEDPVRYAPLKPEDFFSEISRRTTSLCDRLAATLSQPKKQESTEYVWMLSGEQNIDEKAVQMIDQARRQVWIKCPHHVLSRYLVPLRKASKRGIKILIILFGNKASAKNFAFGPKSELYLHEGSGEMLAIGNKQLVIATDFTASLLATFDDHPKGAYTASESVVFMVETMIRHEVYLAEIINAFGPAIEKRFGKELISLRAKYLPANLLRDVKHHLSRIGPASSATAVKKRLPRKNSERS